MSDSEISPKEDDVEIVSGGKSVVVGKTRMGRISRIFPFENHVNTPPSPGHFRNSR